MDEVAVPDSAPTGERTTKAASSLPWKKVIPVYISLWCEAFNSSSIFAYVGFMVVDFGLTKDESDPSYMYYAGLLGSCFFAAQLLSSFLWGTLSDRLGRRPILLFGQTGSLISSVAFGFSFNFGWAMAARSINGLLNGTVGVSKTYLGEICDSTNISKAFGWIGLMWGFGAICGSVLGGVLARPALKYPNYFSPNGLFGKFPYLMPNLCAAAVTLTGIILCYFFLTENPRKPHPPPASERALSEDLGIHELATVEASDSNMVQLDNFTSDESPRLPRNDSSMIELDVEEGSRTLGGYTAVSYKKAGSTLPWYRRGLFARLLQLPAYIKGLPIFHESTPVIACSIYALYGCLHTMADEIWPLWARTPISDGGLAFSTDQIGLSNAWAGMVQLVFNAFLYPIMVGKFGLVRTFYIGLVSAGIIYPLYPLLRYVPLPVKGDVGSFILFWLCVGLLTGLKQIAAQAGFSSVMTIISNSVYPENMGSANGLGQSLVAATRTVAPFVSAAVLAISLKPTAIWPLNYGRAAWYLISGVAVVAFFVALKLPNSINKPRIEAEEEKNEALRNASLGITVSTPTDELNIQSTSADELYNVEPPSSSSSSSSSEEE